MSNLLALEEKSEPLPCDIEMEAHILGIILGNNKKFAEISHFLKEDHFILPANRAVLSIIAEHLASGSSEANIMTLKDVFLADEGVKSAGGIGYISKLYSYSSSMMSIESLAVKIVDLAKRRKIIELSNKLKLAASDSGISLVEIESYLANQSSEIILDTHTNNFKTGYDVMLDILESLNRPVDCDSTGIEKIDDSTEGGFHIGRAYCFAARMKKGKTLLAGTVSHHLAKQGKKHMFIAAEMGSSEVVQRMMAGEIGATPSMFNNPDRAKTRKQAERAVHSYMDNVHFYDSPCVGLDDLKRALHYGVYKLGIRGFILDYWQLVTGKKKGQLDEQHLQEVAQWAAAICKKHKIWCLMTAQVNKEGNLLYGEGVKRAFDQVFELHADDNGGAWLEMLCSRNTVLHSIGSETYPALINVNGTHFRSN